MKHIDFLPDIYRQQRVQRRARRWWCTVAGVFAAAILAASLSQWMVRRSIQRELAEVEPKYAAALTREAELAILKEDIVREEEIAGLYTYLAHPWPRTQILSAVIRPLPASIRLSEINVAFEMLPQGAVILPASSNAQGNTQKAPSPASQDLTQLRSECDGRQVVLSISGTATVLTELHAYVDQVGKSPLIAAAHLKGVESAGTGQAAGEARFHIHVVVLAGYGQAGGPPLDPAVPRAETVSAIDKPLQGGPLP